MKVNATDVDISFASQLLAQVHEQESQLKQLASFSRLQDGVDKKPRAYARRNAIIFVDAEVDSRNEIDSRSGPRSSSEIPLSHMLERCSTCSIDSAIEFVPVDSESISAQDSLAVLKASTSACLLERCSTCSIDSAIEFVPVDSEAICTQDSLVVLKASTSACSLERCLAEPKMEPRRNAVVIMESEAESCYGLQSESIAATFAALKEKLTNMVQCKAAWAERYSTSDAFPPMGQCTEVTPIAAGVMENEAKSRQVSSTPKPSLRELLAKTVQCKSSWAKRCSMAEESSHVIFSVDERSQALSAAYFEQGMSKPIFSVCEADCEHERQSLSTMAPSSRQSLLTTDSSSSTATAP